MSTSVHPVNNALLRDWVGQVDRTTAATEALRAGLSENQLGWKPAGKVWSVNECFQHINQVDTLYRPRIAGVLDEALEAPNARSFKFSLFCKLFGKFVQPDSRWRVPTAPAFEPEQDQIGPESIQRFLDNQEALKALIMRAEGVDLNSNRLTSPITNLIRFSVGEALWVLVVHQQRHLQQAERLTRHPSFP